MDLDDMKQTWAALDNKLSQQQLVNKKLIHKITNEQSRNRLKKIIDYEVFSQAINWFLILCLFAQFNKLDTSFLQVGAGFMLVFSLIWTYLFILLYKKLKAINIQQNTVIEAIQAIYDFKKFYAQYKTTTVGLASLGMIFWIPILVKLLHNKNLFEHLSYFSLPIVGGVIVGFGLMFLIYNKLHEKSIDEVEDLLTELQEMQ